MSQHRWMKFWPQDYESDPALKMCGLEAQGLWVRMICRMHEGSPYGHLTIAQRPITPQKLAVLIGLPFNKVEELLNELRENAVFSETADGVIFSRRMVRDGEHAEAGRTYANQRWAKDSARHTSTTDAPIGVVNREAIAIPTALPNSSGHRSPNTLDTESESDTYPTQSAAPGKSAVGGRKRGTRLPDDWQPNEADREYALELGLDVRRVAENFRGYWLAKAGKDAVKIEWSLTWQAWCRRDADKRGPRPSGFTSGDARANMSSFL